MLDDIDDEDYSQDSDGEKGYDLGVYTVDDKKELTDEELEKQFHKLEIDGDTLPNEHSERVSSDDFDLVALLGKGGYGKVLLVNKRTGKDAGTPYAMKILKKASLFVNLKDVDHTKAERNILKQIRHPFIVQLSYAFQTNSKLYLILEYCPGGELFTQLERNGTLPEPIARFYVSELVLALGHLHSCGVVYRDLKPENIMIAMDGHTKLTDFGLSKENISDNDKTNTFCGTIEYMAPEVLTKTGHNFVCDWWSLGAVLYDMLCGHPPFISDTREKTMDKILRGRLPMHHFMSSDARDLLKGLLRKDPVQRLGHGPDGLMCIQKHPYFKYFNWTEVLNKMYKPPFVPSIKNKTDVSNFDVSFTKTTPLDSLQEEISQSKRDMFKGFSYNVNAPQTQVLERKDINIGENAPRENCYPLGTRQAAIEEKKKTGCRIF